MGVVVEIGVTGAHSSGPHHPVTDTGRRQPNDKAVLDRSTKIGLPPLLEQYVRSDQIGVFVGCCELADDWSMLRNGRRNRSLWLATRRFSPEAGAND